MPLVIGTVPNGDLSSGLAGWGSVGPSAALVAGPLIEAADNTSVISPPFTVPSSAQAVAVGLAVPGANAVVHVRARPVEGGADIALLTVVPARNLTTWDVPLGEVRGRTVRLVIDPVTSLGRRLYVSGVGPIREILPGWDVARGLPEVVAAWGRPSIVARDNPLNLLTPAVTAAAGARFLGLAVRGSGTVRVAIGDRVVRSVASPSRWTAVHVPIPPAGGPVQMSVIATPRSGDTIAVSGVATPAHALRLRDVGVAHAATGIVVRARVVPPVPGARAEVRIGGRVVGRGTVRSSGVLVVRATGAGPARVVITGDAAWVGTSARVILPPVTPRDPPAAGHERMTPYPGNPAESGAPQVRGHMAQATGGRGDLSAPGPGAWRRRSVLTWYARWW